ncbi:signal transduction protein [Candidatus Scalindua japonica]|uniref:Signal transduction protein n=2 Tax=Candidatus Scalindua japonica TaxID=1284222 RepID=A0A286TUJ4_9BACT|nr:signal transduction protein [Candidatus Scalindua japonica]
MRKEWIIEFASGGLEALNIMSNSKFDVIVSDMRMPNMDGSQLLQIVSKQHPECIRIILSGHSDHEMVLGSIKCAHQYMMKPCDTVVVKSIINRACNLRDILKSDELRILVGGMKNLPSLPNSYNLIIEEMNLTEPSLAKVGDIIAHDVSMSAKILQLVNSAFFGLPQKMVNPQQAAIYLGVETLKALVLSTHVFSSFTETSESLDFSLPNLFNHSMAVGNLVKKIMGSESVDQRVKEEAMVAGLLHDIGKLLMLTIPDHYKQIQTFKGDMGCDDLTAEHEVLNTSHAEMGAYLLGLWGLPIGIVESIAFHHHPSRLIGHEFDVSGVAFEVGEKYEKPIDSSGSTSLDVKEYAVLTAVHVADALINQKDCDSDTTEFKYIDMRYLKALGLVEKLPEWVVCYEKVRERGG